MKRVFLLFFAMALFALTSQAQINTPAPSPSCKMEQTVGLTTVTLEYSRPSVKGRTIFAADGLQPYGKPWRVGANAPTKITFSDDVKLESKELKKGTYTLIAWPGAEEWKINFYAFEGGNWSSYLEKTASATIMVKPEVMPMIIESFVMSVGELKDASASLQLIWENIYLGMKLEVEVDKRVMADIERVMDGPGRNDYYAAARYYHDTGKDLEQALEWVRMANEKGERFWQLHREANILADMNRYREAITAAEKSKKMAAEAENEDYVRRNEKAISEWKKKMTDKAGSPKMKSAKE